MYIDLSIVATPVITSLSNPQNEDKGAREIETFHTNNYLSRKPNITFQQLY